MVILIEVNHVVMQLLVLLLDDLLVQFLLVDGLESVVRLSTSDLLGHVEQPQNVGSAGEGLHEPD